MHLSIDHFGARIQNLTTKTGGSNSNKTGLVIESTGAWGTGGTNHFNIGLDVNVSGGVDGNYAALFNGGNVGIGTSSPATDLDVNGQVRASGYELSAPATKFYGITPGEFNLVQESPQGDNELEAPNGNTVFVSSGVDEVGAQIVAPVHLPDGAELQVVEVFGRNTTTENMNVTFVEKSYSTASNNVGTVTITPATTAITSFTVPGVPGLTIDNSANNYLILIDIPTTNSNTADISGVKIEYVKSSVD